MKRLYKAEQIAEKYGICIHTMRSWMRHDYRGLMSCAKKISRIYFFDADLFEKWLEEKNR